MEFKSFIVRHKIISIMTTQNSCYFILFKLKNENEDRTYKQLKKRDTDKTRPFKLAIMRKSLR